MSPDSITVSFLTLYVLNGRQLSFETIWSSETPRSQRSTGYEDFPDTHEFIRRMVSNNVTVLYGFIGCTAFKGFIDSHEFIISLKRHGHLRFGLARENHNYYYTVTIINYEIIINALRWRNSAGNSGNSHRCVIRSCAGDYIRLGPVAWTKHLIN